ncbi:ribonuclease J, partial [Candidatus Dojkabacteria bacterium]|nr:ribonuclease J [Candidatus Dojkabacteria bacterium]
GNDMLVQTLLDDLSQKGAFVYQNKEHMDLHSSGHGYQEDQKIMLNLVKPKFFIPVHGYQSFLYKHGQTAQKTGVPEKNVIITKKGSVIELTKHEWKKLPSIKATPVLVSGSGVGDIGNIVLNDRQQLANYGVVVIVTELDTEKRIVTNPPQVVTRGFVFVKNSTDLIKRIEAETLNIFNNEKIFFEEQEKIKEKISMVIRKILYDETQREPMILPILIENKKV